MNTSSPSDGLSPAHVEMVLEVERQNSRVMIGDPRKAPIASTEAHLPSVDGKSLGKEFIRNALRQLPFVPAATVGDGSRFAGRSIRQAAVLLALVQRENDINVLFTQRALHLRDHPGQISFPGGACDASDENGWHTAYREAWEEIGLERNYLEPLGQLHTYTTVTAFAVTPHVAWLSNEAIFKVNAQEVDSVFEVPLQFLINPVNHQKRSVQTEVGERSFHSIPYVDEAGVERFIWGATAGMIRNLHRVLAFDLKSNT